MRYLVAVFLLVVCMVGIVLASYDTPPQTRANPDLADFIIQTPAKMYETHGYSERTAIMFNLARFKELYIESAGQIKALNDRVKALEDRVKMLEGSLPSVIDVNSTN